MTTMGRDLLQDHAAPGYDDPLGMLSACHRRIERQLATLQARHQRLEIGQGLLESGLSGGACHGRGTLHSRVTLG